MNANEQRDEFLILYDRVSNLEAPGLTDNEVGILLTKAQEVLLKEAYEPYKSFEETEKQRKIYNELKSYSEVTTPSSSQTGVHENGVFFDLPSDFLYTLSEEAEISSSDSCIDGTRIGIHPITEDEYVRNKDNPFKKASEKQILRMDYSRETVGDGNIKRHELITGSTYSVSKYHIWYIRRPNDIVPTGDGTTSSQQDCELDEIAHRPIIDIAVRIATGITEPQEYQLKLNEEKINESKN